MSAEGTLQTVLTGKVPQTGIHNILQIPNYILVVLCQNYKSSQPTFYDLLIMLQLSNLQCRCTVHSGDQYCTIYVDL